MRLKYTGGYAPGVPVTAHYGPGTVVRVSRSRGKVTVRLDTPDELYADWPLDQVAEIGDRDNAR